MFLIIINILLVILAVTYYSRKARINRTYALIRELSKEKGDQKIIEHLLHQGVYCNKLVKKTKDDQGVYLTSMCAMVSHSIADKVINRYLRFSKLNRVDDLQLVEFLTVLYQSNHADLFIKLFGMIKFSEDSKKMVLDGFMSHSIFVDKDMLWVKTLLILGADLNVLDKDGCSVIFKLNDMYSIKEYEWMINNGLDYKFEVVPYGQELKVSRIKNSEKYKNLLILIDKNKSKNS